MNFKRFFSTFLLFTVLTSSFSLPTSVYAEDCKVVNAKFTQKPKGANWYNSDSTAHLLVAINNLEACKDKKIKVKVIAKSSSTGEDSIDATKTPLEAVFDQGATSMSVPFKVKEEGCFDLDSWNITNDFDGAYDLKDILSKVGKEETEFYTNVYEQLKSGKVGDDLMTLHFIGQNAQILNGFYGLLNLSGLSSVVIDEELVKMPLFTQEERSALTNNKDSIQKILNRIQAIELPADKALLPVWISNFTQGGSALGLVNDIQEGTFRDVVAKTIFYKAGVADCVYQIQIDDPSTPEEKFEDSEGGDFAFMCDIGWTAVGNDCNSGKWEKVSGFSPGIRPTKETSSLCYNEEIKDYDEDCYETLAPIPGFGRKLNFSEDGEKGEPFTLGTYIGTIIKIAIGAASVAAVIFLIYAGLQYMVAGKSGGGALLDKARKRIYSIGWGILVLLGSWILLNTINPELLKINPKFEKITLEAPSFPRNDDPEFVKYQEKFKIDSTPIDISKINNPVLIAYLYHQQGEGGAPSILWAARKGYSSVPLSTPFIKGNNNVNGSLSGNYPKDCKDALGPVSPKNFVECWVKKVEIFKTKTNTVPANVAPAIEEAARQTGVDVQMLKVFCLIETSGCAGVTTTNRYGYTGLFQLSLDVYKKYGPGGGDRRKEALPNAIAGAAYAKYHFGRYDKHKVKIESN